MSHFQSDARWCIVVADAAGPSWWVPEEEGGASWMPIQYCGLGEPTTMLQKALHRAVRVSSAAHVLVTTAEVHRLHWQGALWCVRPEHRFVSECPGWSALTTASALLWIAARAPSAVVTILPARCYVADEWTLAVALHRALNERSLDVDDVVTLGISTADSGIDEDYLSLRASDPLSSGARPGKLRTLIASGIYIGYASTLAMRLYKHWPTLTHELLRQLAGSFDEGGERCVPQRLARQATREAPGRCWDRSPWVPRQVLRVRPCGWSGLQSIRGIERVVRATRSPTQAIATGVAASTLGKYAEG